MEEYKDEHRTPNRKELAGNWRMATYLTKNKLIWAQIH